MNLKTFLFNFKPLNVLRFNVCKSDDLFEPVLKLVLNMHDVIHVEKLNLICDIYGVHMDIIGLFIDNYSCETELCISVSPDIISDFCSHFDDFLLV